MATRVDHHAQRECLGRLFADNIPQCALDAMRMNKDLSTSTLCRYVAKMNNIFGSLIRWCWVSPHQCGPAIECGEERCSDKSKVVPGTA